MLSSSIVHTANGDKVERIEVLPIFGMRVFGKITVKGPDKHPLYGLLTKAQPEKRRSSRAACCARGWPKAAQGANPAR